MEIREVDKAEFLGLVYANHYSLTMPRHTKHYLGAFQGDRLVGVVSLGWGTQPKATIRKLFPMLDTHDYFEIGKMAMLEEMPRNSESQMLSAVVKWIKANLDIKFLFTWADGIVGKPGYVYQAANFYYGGFIWTDIYMSATGEKIHPRSTKALLRENAEYEGTGKLFWLTHSFCAAKGIKRFRGKQFRYIYPLSKQGKRLLSQSTVEWRQLGYPKDSDLVWKLQVGKGAYETTTTRPTFEKFSIEVNQRNYDENYLPTLP